MFSLHLGGRTLLRPLISNEGVVVMELRPHACFTGFTFSAHHALPRNGRSDTMS